MAYVGWEEKADVFFMCMLVTALREFAYSHTSLFLEGRLFYSVVATFGDDRHVYLTGTRWRVIH